MTQLAVVPQQESGIQSASLGFEPQTMKDVWRLAEIVVASGLGPKSVRTPEAAMVIIITGRELGLTSMQSLRSIHVVEGRAVLDATLIMALCLRLPLCERFSCSKSDGQIASFVAKRRGQPETALSFTIDQAKAAGLTGKDNWKKYPDAMLRARCIAALARLVFPDAMLGVYERDEIPGGDDTRASDADVRTVPGPRPSPAPSSGSRPTLDSHLDGILARLAAASTPVDVGVAIEEIKAIGREFTKDHPRRPEVMAAYKAAEARVKSTPPAPVADAEGVIEEREPSDDAPREREPGED